MQDPDSIQITNNALPSEIKITKINDFECEAYNIDDEKDFNKYITDIERIIRKSYEYRSFINYLRDNMGMDKCAFLKDVSNAEDKSIRIEIHHYPFTLRDIVEIVYNKRNYYAESLSVFMVAKEVMSLHYKLMVGLIPLSETVHQLYHNGRLFIPIDKVLGRYTLFIDYYKPFIDPILLDNISRIEKYTAEHSAIGDTTILDQNTISFKITDKNFILPKVKNISDSMVKRLEVIKNNNYMLPTIDDVKMLESHDEDIAKKIHSPIIFK